MGFILSIIAYLLFIPLAVVNFVFVIIKFTKSRGFFKVVDKYWYLSALDLDRFGNHHFRTFFNMSCKAKLGYQFGDINETISSALGKNQIDNTLTWFGWLLVYILWIIDVKYWWKGGHCLNSINI
jgi:hypothetical protein